MLLRLEDVWRAIHPEQTDFIWLRKKLPCSVERILLVAVKILRFIKTSMLTLSVELNRER